MKKIYQNKYGLVDGNCFEVCVATLTGIPLVEIPCFEGEDGSWIGAFFIWGKEKGYNITRIKDPLSGNIQISQKTRAIGIDNTHAFIVNCNTTFSGKIMTTTFDLWHNPLKGNNDIDVNKIIVIYIIEKGNNEN